MQEAAERVLPFSDPERAREAGRKGGQARAANARLIQEDPEQWARQAFARERAALTKALLDAALGRGDFTDLAPEKRLSALTRSLEYAVGKPRTRSAADETASEPEEDSGLVIE